MDPVTISVALVCVGATILNMTVGVSDLPGRPKGFDVYPDGYGRLFDSAVEVFFGDERVRGMWLHGAFGRGGADAASDLDISIAIRDEAFDEYAESWRGWLATITPTVNADPIAPGCFFAMTTGCERFDVISERVSDLPATPLTRRVTIFDRDNLDATIPARADPPPNPDTIAYVIKETLRTAANFDTVVVRDDWLLGVVSVQTVQMLLYQLFAEANKPQPPTGPKQWSFKLSSRHRQLLESLPVPQPERESVMAARQAAFGAFFTEAPRIADANNVPWPDDLERTVRSHLDHIGYGLAQPARSEDVDDAGDRLAPILIKSLPAPWHTRVVTSAAKQLPREPGVVAVWVGGSLANGVGDVYSDVDLNLVVEDDTVDFWRTHWPDVLERCAGKLILAGNLGGPIVGGFAVTEAWEHIDFIVHPRSDHQQPASNLPIYDPDNLLAATAPSDSADTPYYPAGPVRFFHYLVGNLVVTLGRGELLVAHSGVNALRDQLINLMLAENGIRKTDGNKRLNPYLTQQQRACLEHLPTPPVSEQAITEACRAITAEFVARARLLAETTGDSFPEELLAATDRHLSKHLDSWVQVATVKDPSPPAVRGY